MTVDSIPEHLRPLRDRALRFIETHIYPHEPLLFSGTPAARLKQAELITMAKADGLFALGHPKHMGGGGLPWLDYAYINEVIGRSDAALDIFGSYTVQTCLMLDAAGTARQKETLVYPQVRGETYVAFSVTEPDAASSDPTNIQTTAVLAGDHWVLNGRKWFISGLDHADWVCFMCRTEGEEAALHERFSMIVVPIDAPGLNVVRDLHTMGLRHFNHPEVTLKDVRVPADHLLGKRGQGFELFQVRLGPARITNCMRWLGQAQRAFDLMCNRANSRKVADGKPLADKQLIQQYVYDSYVELQSARLLVLDAAARLDRGDQARVEVSAIKCYCARMLHNVIDRALQVHGALGVSEGTPLEHMYRMARIYRIVDGPDEVHIERVGKLLLRQYREGKPFDFGLH
jgi:acyl-CoA dehydrogenase